MDIYLPIAELSVNALVIVGFGVLVGVLSGMFGVGGGFLTTPMLIFYGIPPAIAVASSATQITGSSVSGALAHWRRGGVDPKMGAVIVAGGVVGSGIGSYLFKLLQKIGQIDISISLIYVVFLSTMGGLMLVESWQTLRRARAGEIRRVKLHPHIPLIAALPWKMRFYKSGLYISPLAPFGIGVIVGILTFIMGIGGGFIMVPAMIYLLGMSVSVVVGTSLFQIVFTTSIITLLHAVQSKTVDIVLALMLLIGGVVGAQIGARMAQRLPPEKLRFALALLVIAVAIRLLVGLTWTPSELYSVYAE
ncbi:sulfite exporter TauE/SafE family protein [Sphingosinicella microcystinivorans]|uniref:sulfite exporter TauE/SafE family protein n=1 Tax=Sphingosinicella microcystinivorans TaxID=335406 RepID=UPI0022F3B94F|nr:sulfite exporter TauE/SafE family protein [Sphingosinicella microcystinivorans]WBX85678.1 sulfite exporter TauE/SafE family protein [Sphingosinicella microcystinivorans]